MKKPRFGLTMDPLVGEAFLQGDVLDEKLMMDLGKLCKDALAGADKVMPAPSLQAVPK